MTRRIIASGGPWEHPGGYSRAVVVGDACWVAGTTDAGPDGTSRHPGDVAGQARAAFEIIEGALSQAGFAISEVVRTRMYVTDIEHAFGPLLAIHGEVFRNVRPAATMIEVRALVHPSLLVEVEVEARKG
jgi:enamine deaminase RidA (YjgF/YER057c/UK114 family)